jgi:hypothetical protein
MSGSMSMQTVRSGWTAALICERRVSEAVREDDCATVPGGLDHFVEVLGARREVEEHLGDGAELVVVRVKQDIADLPADSRATGLLRLDYFFTFLP